MTSLEHVETDHRRRPVSANQCVPDEADVACSQRSERGCVPDQADGSGQQLVTPPLDGTILPGVTRDSVLALARAWGEADVLEANITVRDLTQVCMASSLIAASHSNCWTILCGRILLPKHA